MLKEMNSSFPREKEGSWTDRAVTMVSLAEVLRPSDISSIINTPNISISTSHSCETLPMKCLGCF